MDSKISLVPTHSLGNDEQNNDNSKPQKQYKSRGKHQGFYRKNPKTHDNSRKNDNHNDQPNEQREGRNDRAQGQNQRQDQGHYSYGSYGSYGYYGDGNGDGYNDSDYVDQQDYVFTCEFPRCPDYNNQKLLSQTFPHLKDINTNTLNINNLTQARCYIMRSNNEDDIHKAIKYGIWTSTQKSNEFLNNLYEECAPKNIPIFLFFSVVRSGQFVGVAQMTSKIIEKSFQFWWEGDKWINHFQIKWLFIKDITYKFFSHLYMDDDLPVTRARDCTGVPFEATKKMLKIYQNFDRYNTIFNDFAFMDIREDRLRSYKLSVQAYQNYLMAGEAYNNGYAMQASTNYAYQAPPQYFKYNTVPGKKDNTNSTSQEQSGKKSAADELESLFSEFDLTHTFYDGEKKKWKKDYQEINSKVANKSSEELVSQCEELKSREKEITEGLEVLENKYKAVTQGVQECEKGIDEATKQAFQKRVPNLTQLLEGFKSDFANSKKDVDTLYEKVKGFKSA